MKNVIKSTVFTVFISVILCALFSLCVSADAPKLIANSTEAVAGSTADITISLADNPGLIVMRLGIGYDDEYFSVKSVADTKLLQENMHSTTRDVSPYILYWNNPLLRTNITDSGDLVTITFNVAENTPNGTYEISISKKNSDILTTDLKKIGDSFETVSGFITVTGGTEPDGENGSSVSSDSSSSSESSENTPTLKLSSKSIDAGEEFDISVSLSDNPGIIALRTMLSYNDKYFTVKKVVDHGVLGETFFSESLDAEPYVLYWSNPLLTKNITKNGKLVTVTFECAENTPSGKYNFTLDCDNTDIVDTDLGLWGDKFEFVDGVVTVASSVSDDNKETVVDGSYEYSYKDGRVQIVLKASAVSFGEGVLVNLDSNDAKTAISAAVKKYIGKPVDITVAFTSEIDSRLVVNFPKGYANVISDADTFTIDTNMADITLDNEAILEISKVGDSVQFIFGSSELDDEIADLIDNEYAYYDISSTVKFKNGSAVVTLPYEAVSELVGSYAVVYTVEDKGIADTGDDVKFENGKLVFTTNNIRPYIVTVEALGFTDIENHWARDYINFVAARGIFNGRSAEIFDPDSELSRGMLVTVLGRLEKVDISGYNCMFDDVDKNLYYAPYIEWARQNNIVGGVGDNKFLPDRSVTRQEIAVIVARYLEYKKQELVLDSMDYADEESIDSWAIDSVNKVGNAGIITGIGENFSPKTSATRAQAATILKRIISLLG